MTQITFENGMKLVDEDRNEYTVTYVTTRVVVIVRDRDGHTDGGVSHAFASAKYRVKKA